MGRKPDFVLKARRVKSSRADNGKGRIGVAWLNDNGSISIDLDPFIVLSSVEELQITLFPNDQDE